MKTRYIALSLACCVLIGAAAVLGKFYWDFPAGHSNSTEISDGIQFPIPPGTGRFRDYGFTDSTAFARIEIARGEFDRLFEIWPLGEPIKPHVVAPFWWSKPVGTVRVRDRLNDQTYRDFTQAHYDMSAGLAYFYRFSH
jgi:hypothetical protein